MKSARAKKHFLRGLLLLAFVLWLIVEALRHPHLP